MKSQTLRWGAVSLAFSAGLASGLYLSRKKFSFAGKTIVITGGSRGLGLLLARQFAGEQAKVALLARDHRELMRAETELVTAGAQVLEIPCDLRKQTEVESAINSVVERFGRIDVLINNAGIIQVGPLEHMTVADFENAMAVHFYGPLYTCLAALPYLKRSGDGRIVNIASIGGKIAVPHMAPYTASKFALVGLSDALRTELRKDNIKVTTVCPWPMRTGSPTNAQFKGKYRREYAWFALMDSLPLLSIDADAAAKKIISACRRGSPRLLLGVQTKAAVLLQELFPGAVAQLAAFANKLLPAPDLSAGKELHLGWESETGLTRSWLTHLSQQAALRNNEISNN